MKKLFAFIIFISLAGVSAAAYAAEWTNAIQEAVKRNDYNQISIIGASHPEAQGAIALYLLQLAQTYKSDPDREVQIFKAATPFVGQIPVADAATADQAIASFLQLAADKDFQEKHPHEAAEIFLSALVASSQPNVVAEDPNLHAEVLEAADDFVKRHPQDVDRRLLEEVSLAQAGGAPETTPRSYINPSAE